jgi:hypothetical protein
VVAAVAVAVAAAVVAVAVVVAVVVAEGGNDHETEENINDVKTIPRGLLDKCLLHSASRS